MIQLCLQILGLVFHCIINQLEARQRLWFPQSDLLPQRLASSTGSIVPRVGKGVRF